MPEQRKLYKDYLDTKEISSIIKGDGNVFIGLLNLRKICNHPHLYDGGPKIIKSTTIKPSRIPSYGLLLQDKELEPGEIIDEEEFDLELSPDDSFGSWKKSGKMVVVETLLKLWRKQGQKVLLFTQGRQVQKSDYQLSSGSDTFCTCFIFADKTVFLNRCFVSSKIL